MQMNLIFNVKSCAFDLIAYPFWQSTCIRYKFFYFIIHIDKNAIKTKEHFMNLNDGLMTVYLLSSKKNVCQNTECVYEWFYQIRFFFNLIIDSWQLTFFNNFHYFYQNFSVFSVRKSLQSTCPLKKTCARRHVNKNVVFSSSSARDADDTEWPTIRYRVRTVRFVVVHLHVS